MIKIGGTVALLCGIAGVAITLAADQNPWFAVWGVFNICLGLCVLGAS